MYKFNYHKPQSLDEARALLKSNEEGIFLAGGMTLLPAMKMRLASPSDLVDLGQIEELKGISIGPDTVQIGAMTSHADVAASAEVQTMIPALAELAGSIGDAQVRNRGTLGGSICNSDPAADYPAAVLGLDAMVVTDRREIAADDFFVGMFETALHESEIVKAVRFPKPQRAAYAKFSNPASGYAIVGVMVAQTSSGIRVAVTGAGPNAFRASALEAKLTADFSAADLDEINIDHSDLNGDIHASPEYRARLVVVMAKQAVRALGG